MYSSFDAFIVYGQALASLFLFFFLIIAVIVGIVLLIRAICAINVYIRKNSVSQTNYSIPQIPTDDFKADAKTDDFFSKVDEKAEEDTTETDTDNKTE